MKFYLRAECNLDTLVFRTLFRARLETLGGIHALNWAEVIKQLRNHRLTVPMVGCIDNDKDKQRQTEIENEFQLYKRHRHYLIYLKKNTTVPVVLIIVGQQHTAIEDFLLSAVQIAKLDPAAFGFSADPAELTPFTKQKEEAILKRFPQLPNLLHQITSQSGNLFAQLKADLDTVLQPAVPPKGRTRK